MGFGNLGNMGEMLKMAREMQHKMNQVKNELKNDMFDAQVGGVFVKMNGEMEIREFKIDTDEMSNQAKLEKNVKDAFSRVIKDSKEGAARKMKGLTGGMNIPGLM